MATSLVYHVEERGWVVKVIRQREGRGGDVKWNVVYTCLSAMMTRGGVVIEYVLGHSPLCQWRTRILIN